MSKRICLLLLLLAGVSSSFGNKQENWLKVSTDHFTVICNGNEKQARHIGDQFERMRLLFHTLFPKIVDPSAPIVVIAVKDEKDFRALEPEAYLAKGQLQLAGLFLRAPDKNYVLVRMDAVGPHPYATVYHEYTHLLLSKIEWIPLWLDEGIAEFYQNTDIGEKETILGQPSPDDLIWLHQNRLLPLPTLFAVDHTSPYYHQEQKGTIFYAESWALTHYLMVNDFKNGTTKITDYLSQLGPQGDPVATAAHVFGDLKQLQSALDKYIAQSVFTDLRLKKALPVDDSSFKVLPISATEADANRADFLAYNQREKDARALLQQVLHDDPNSTLAHETMGVLEFHAGNTEEAQKWYGEAVKLDSQSYLANYYFGAITMQLGKSGEDTDKEIEESLRKAVKLNPQFAPAYDELGVFFGMRHKNLDEAHMLGLQAVQLEPSNVRFRMNVANVLMAAQRDKDAHAVLENALKVAKTPEEAAAIQNALQMVENYQSVKERNEQEMRAYSDALAASKQSKNGAAEADSNVTVDEEKDEPVSGPRRSVTGTVKSVRCAEPAVMDVDVEAGSKTVTLHTRNFYKIQFSALNYTPKAEFRPCSDLEGMRAKIEYVEGTATTVNSLVAIELQK